MSSYLTPRKRTQQRVVAAAVKELESGWRSVLEKDSSLKAPWHFSRMEFVASAAMSPNATTETKLRSAYTLRRAVEMASPSQKAEALRQPIIGGAIHYFLEHNREDCASNARLQEHALMTIVHALGSEELLDEELVMDDRMIQQLHACLCSSFVVVVAAAAQLIRRISELDHVCHVLGFNEVLLEDIFALLETVPDARVHVHVMSTMINMAAHPKLQFMLARSTRLVKWLLDCVGVFLSTTDHTAITGQLGGDVQDNGEHHMVRSPGASRDASRVPSALSDRFVVTSTAAWKSARVLANLLSNPANRAEILRVIPNIYDVMLDAQRSQVSPELQEASKCVIHLLHDDVAVLHAELSAAVAVAPPTSIRRVT